MDYKLKDLIDIPKLQSLLDTLDEIYSLPSAIIDADGNILTATAWQDICTKFHRINPETEKKCKESDSYIARELYKNPPYVVYKCHMGLIDTATPIIVEGHHLGNIFTGQLFLEQPDREKFICQAREYGFNEKDYLDALNKVPIISEKRLHKNLKLLGNLTQMLAAQGMINKRQLLNEEALKQKEERLKLATGSAKLGIWDWDIVNNSMVWDDRMFELYGHTPETFPGGIEAWQDGLHPDDRDKIIAECEAALRGENEWNAVFRLMNPDGTVKHIKATGLIVRNSEGKAVRMLGVNEDITESKQTTEDLLNTKRELLEAQRIANIGNWDLNLQNNTSKWSDESYRIFGFEPGAFDPTFDKFLSSVHPDDRKKVESYFTDIFSGKLSDLEFDMRIIRPSGEERFIKIKLEVLRDNSGMPFRLMGTSLDITEQKKKDEVLRERERVFNTLIENLPGFVYRCRNDRQRTIQFISTGCLAVTGYRPEDFIDNRTLTFSSIQLPHYVEPLWLKWQDCLVERQPFEDVYKIRTSVGDIKWVWERGRGVFGGDEQLLYIEGYIEDITEHRILEDQLRQAQKMEGIGQMAGGIAHDFNNILSAIVGYGHIALMGMAEDDPQKKNIEIILEAAGRATHLIKDLLLFSSKQASHLKTVDLNEIIRTVNKFIKRVIGEDIEITTTLQNWPIPVLLDPHHMEQVFMNLATNARDAMQKGGTFSIKTEEVLLGSEFCSEHGFGKPGRYALVSISDTGCGMDKETIKKVFDPFFTTKEVGKGTGLGLAVVYGIVKQHNGYIHIHSEMGIGTTFKIYLPVTESKPAEEKPADIEEMPEFGTETILIAEDDETVRKLLHSILTYHGYKVIVSIDGEDAISKFKDNMEKIQLLLFDLVMPKMNGVDAYNEIRKIRPDIKAIFASGYSPDIVRQKIILDKDAVLIYKPVAPIYLLSKIREVLNNLGIVKFGIITN